MPSLPKTDGPSRAKPCEDESSGSLSRRAHEVLESMDPFLVGIDTVVFFAGKRCREFLEPGLRERGVAVAVPMLG